MMVLIEANRYYKHILTVKSEFTSRNVHFFGYIIEMKRGGISHNLEQEKVKKSILS